VVLVLGVGCAGDQETSRDGRIIAMKESLRGSTVEDPHAKARSRMISTLGAYGIRNPAVIEAMQAVPRHRFVPADQRSHAYWDGPLPIGHGQTISQPYIVARMTELSKAAPGMTVLDVGTGSGYQAAVLAEIVQRVYSIEIVCPLADAAAKLLRELQYSRVEVRCGDGFRGWPAHAPFDAIIVAAAPEQVPPPLLEQLKVGGRLVIPVGPEGGVQSLRVYEKQADGAMRRFEDGAVRFVPMTGEAQGN
jgi:protein-L-isoaspartate(D-aspartate) O-methyltransferase